MVVRWTFTDVNQAGEAPWEYTFAINPNDGGTPTATKNVTTLAAGSGADGGAVVQEGAMIAPEMSFSGVILAQSHLEAFERWFNKRILIEITDDLGRSFRGVFTKWEPQRSYRPRNPWFHTFSAGFTLVGYKNASGEELYGRFS